jgi:hypothetical protein
VLRKYKSATQQQLNRIHVAGYNKKIFSPGEDLKARNIAPLQGMGHN